MNATTHNQAIREVKQYNTFVKKFYASKKEYKFNLTETLESGATVTIKRLTGRFSATYADMNTQTYRTASGKTAYAAIKALFAN